MDLGLSPLAHLSSPLWQVVVTSAVVSALVTGAGEVWRQLREHKHEREQALRQLMIEAADAFFATATRVTFKLPILNAEIAEESEHLTARREAVEAGKEKPERSDVDLPAPLRDSLSATGKELAAALSDFRRLRSEASARAGRVKILFGSSPAVNDTVLFVAALGELVRQGPQIAASLTDAKTYGDYNAVWLMWIPMRDDFRRGVEGFPANAREAIQRPLAVWDRH